jgi:hypothetical protein
VSQKRIPVEETFSWQRPIIDKDLTAPPASTKGDRYIVGASPSGIWVGHEKNIAWYDGVIWNFDVPIEGWICHVNDEDTFYKYDGSVWEIYNIHSHSNKSILDLVEQALTSELKTAYDGAVTATHGHSNKSILDNIQEAFTTALKSAYDGVVTDSHAHANKSTLNAIEQAFTTTLKNKLDGIESGAVSLATVKEDSDVSDAISKKHSHTNNEILDTIEVALTSALKSSYDTAVSRMASYDADLGCIIIDC